MQSRRSRPTSPPWGLTMADLIDRAMALVSESFITATGPGGQNVNKVATAVQLRLDVYALRLEPEVFHRFKQLAGSRMTAKGELVLTARAFAPRKPTAPTRASAWPSCSKKRRSCPKSAPKAGSTASARPSGWPARNAAAQSRPGAGGSRSTDYGLAAGVGAGLAAAAASAGRRWASSICAASSSALASPTLTPPGPASLSALPQPVSASAARAVRIGASRKGLLLGGRRGTVTSGRSGSRSSSCRIAGRVGRRAGFGRSRVNSRSGRRIDAAHRFFGRHFDIVGRCRLIGAVAAAAGGKREAGGNEGGESDLLHGQSLCCSLGQSLANPRAFYALATRLPTVRWRRSTAANARLITYKDFFI